MVGLLIHLESQRNMCISFHHILKVTIRGVCPHFSTSDLEACPSEVDLSAVTESMCNIIG